MIVDVTTFRPDMPTLETQVMFCRECGDNSDHDASVFFAESSAWQMTHAAVTGHEHYWRFTVVRQPSQYRANAFARGYGLREE